MTDDTILHVKPFRIEYHQLCGADVVPFHSAFDYEEQKGQKLGDRKNFIIIYLYTETFQKETA